MANLLPPPVLVSEHGRGQMTIKAHTRKSPSKTVTVVRAPGNATGVPARTVPQNPVDAQVAAAQLPAQQQIAAAQAASSQAAKNQAQTIQGYYQALAGILGNIGPATQAGYSTAAGNDAAFGKGFSDGMQHIQDQTGAEATNIAGIAGAAPPTAPTSDAANALYALGGYIPASTMNREGAAFGAAANLLPATAAGQGAASIRQVGAQQALDQQGFTKQLADLAAQVPGLRAQYQGAADSQANEAAKLAQDRTDSANHERDVRIQQQLQYIAATGVDPKTGKLTPKAQLEWNRVMGGLAVAETNAKTAQTRAVTGQVNAQTAIDRLSLSQQKAYSDMYGVDANGKLTLAGRKAALAEWKAEHPASKGGFTKKQLADLSGKAAKLADLYFYGTPDKTSAGGVVTKGIPAIDDYQKALKLALSNGIPMAIAQRALNALYPIGAENRPYIPIQQRMLLEQAGLPMSNPVGAPTRAQAQWLNAHGHSYSGPIADPLAGKTG